jgi:hypothetical protein
MSQEVGTEALEPGLCPVCGCPNDCQLSSAGLNKGPCWCSSIAVPEGLLAQVAPELKNRACICRICVTEYWQKQTDKTPEPIPARDFYFDKDGLMVFTAEYHLRRGYCCESGCRHCPFPTSK